MRKASPPMTYKEAYALAEKICRMVQGSAALEGCGISDESVFRRMIDDSAKWLLRKDAKRLALNAKRQTHRMNKKPPDAVGEHPGVAGMEVKHV